MKRNWKLIGILLGVFVLGAATGSALTRFFVHRQMAGLFGPEGERSRRFKLRALSRRLDLSASQERAVGEIMRRHSPERRRLMREAMQACGPRMRAHKAAVDAEIRQLLSPEQQKRFDELVRMQDRKWFGHPPR